jgi:hypothetical protein
MRAEELADEIKSLANSRTVSKLHQRKPVSFEILVLIH